MTMKNKSEKLLTKLKRVYIKMLSAYARRKIEKAYKLEDKAILLELQLKEQRRLIDEIDEGFDALKEKNIGQNL
jgi:hypothetical protein